MDAPAHVIEAVATPKAGRRRTGTMVAIAALLALAAIVALHAMLLPGGRWQGDEYGGLAAYHAQGLAFLKYRLLSWSPRPVSETLIYLYARLVYAVRQPMIAAVLGFGWGLLILAAIAGSGGARSVWTGLIVAAVLAAFLLGHPVGEMFYWPMGALAYLPALAGVTAAAFLIIRGVAGGTRRRLWVAAALLLASCSAEVGAMVTLCAGGLIALTELPGWRRRPFACVVLEAGGWAIPLVAAALVLGLLLTGRAGSSFEAQPGDIAHHVPPSLAAAADWFARLLIAPGAPITTPWRDLPPSLAWWLPLLGLGLACAWRESGVVAAPTRQLLALAAGLLIAAYASLASAAWQFGAPCCERHDTFRACLVVLALAALAAVASRRGGAGFWRRVPVAAGPALLLLGLLPPALDRWPAWWADHRQQGAVIAVRRADWAAGEAPGPAMRFRQPPAPHVVNDGLLPARGHYNKAAGNVPWFVTGVLDFFGKSAIDIGGR